MLLIAVLLLGAIATTSPVNCRPLPHRNMAAQQQLGNILQQAAKNFLNKIESKPSSQPALKLHIRPIQQPQNYYNGPAREAPAWRPTTAKQPSVSPVNLHIHHPFKTAQPPLQQPVQEMPGIHLYPPQQHPPQQPPQQPPQPQPPAPSSNIPHVHIHPTSPRQRVAVIKPHLPFRTSTPVKAPVVHVHPPTQSGDAGKPSGDGKDRKENDVQLKLNMDFKAHNRTGFQELQRQVERAELQSVNQEIEQLMTKRIAQKLEELLLSL